MPNCRPALLFVLLSATTAGVAVARDEIRPDFEMDRDPDIQVPAIVQVFPERQKTLWLQALARPEADMQRMAAEAIGRAHAAGAPGLREAVPALTVVLTAPNSRPAARLAAARALVRLESKEVARQMAEASMKYGADLRQIVEPALAAWNDEPQRAVWRARLTETHVRHRDLVLAVRCLTAADDGSVAANLLDMANDRQRPPDVRLEAARGAGLLQQQGLEADARRLIAADAQPPLLNRLCAVRLIDRHAGDEAKALLVQLAADEEPAVAAVALTRLREIDPHEALPLAPRAIASPDAKLRQSGADIYIQLPDRQRVGVLARLLADPHPAVRASIREALFDLDQRPELKEAIRQTTMDVLAANDWRGLEQAGLLLAALNHRPAAGRLVELLEAERTEVAVTAGWGLKKLAVPETLAPMLDKATRNTQKRKSGPFPLGLDEQTAHLLEAFGQMKYEPAEPLLRQHVPKDYAMGFNSRSSAIWSLGLLHAGIPDEALAAQLAERAADVASIPPEMPPVQIMSIVTIGRMKAVSQVEALRHLPGIGISPTRLGLSLRWALMELTGEQIPVPPPYRTGMPGWFLEPIDD